MALIADDGRSTAREALDGLDRLLDAVPPDTAIPAREIGALVRLIRAALHPLRDRDPTLHVD
jgi:hypothetical protein